MRINHNIAALNTHRQLNSASSAQSKSMEKLSSGLRINRAGDDAAGLAISEKMRGQIRGLDMAAKNSQDAISMIQTAEGALNETHSILQRMRELAVQSSNDTNTDTDRGEIQKEINELTSEINRIGNTTEFNTKKLLNGSLENTFKSEVTGSHLATGASVTAGGFNTSLNGTTLPAGNYKLEVTKTNVNTDYTEAMKLASDMNYTGVTPGTSPKFEGSKIEITDAANPMISGGSATITFEKVSDTEIKVSISGGTSGRADDVITADADGKFNYDDHGIKFTLDSLGTMDDAETFTADLTAANLVAGSVGTEQTGWTSVTTTGTDPSFTNTSGGVDVAAEALAGTWTGAFDGTNLTMTFAGDDGSTFTDVIAKVGSTYTYDSHGISFAINEGDTPTTVGTFGFTVKDKFDIEAKLTNTDTGATVETKTLASDYNGSDTTGSITGTIAGLSFAQSGALTAGTQTFEVEATVVESGSNKSATFQIGANENQSMSLSFSDMRASALGITGSGAGFSTDNNVTNGTDNNMAEKALDVTSAENAAKAITALDEATKRVSAERSKLGASQNRLEHTINNLGTASENLTAAESRIRDVDMAKEMMEQTKNSILSQAAQAMLAQSNQMPQGVLQLLR